MYVSGFHASNKSPVSHISRTAVRLTPQELAKELGDFLLSPRPGRPPLLDEHRGMVLLSDCYCLFNRARGTALVSPEDLIRACQILTDLKLGLGLKTFPSGVAVLQADRWSEEVRRKGNVGLTILG